MCGRMYIIPISMYQYKIKQSFQIETNFFLFRGAFTAANRPLEDAFLSHD